MRKKIITILSLISTQVLLLAGPLDGVWVNTDAASKHTKVIISSEPGKDAKFSTQYEDKVTELKLTLLGDSVSEKNPNKYGYVFHDLNFKKNIYFISRKGENLEVKVVCVFKEGDRRPGMQHTYIYKK